MVKRFKYINTLEISQIETKQNKQETGKTKLSPHQFKIKMFSMALCNK